MIRYSVQMKHQIFVKCYGFLSFPKNVGKNNGKIRIKNLSAKQSATDAF